MNNWRLLLLAIVAVFQPIASFTDRNLIDGRQQCCDRLSSAPLQDTRSLLHGTYRLGKTTSSPRRLNDRDEIHEDRRYEVLRQRDSMVSRLATERPLVENRERFARQTPSVIARPSRVEYRLERAASQSRERLLDVQKRERTTQHIRDLKSQDHTRRVFDRTSRDAVERRNENIITKTLRDDYSTERSGEERLSDKLFYSQREMQREQIRSGERRTTLNRDARRVIRTKYDVGSSNMNNRQRIARERLSVVRRETTVRADTRRYLDQNNEPRDLQRNSEQRRLLSENTRSADRIRDLHVRLNAREEDRVNLQRISGSRRLAIERFDEREQREDRREFREQNKENTERKATGDRMQMSRRITRESRIIKEIRHNERLSREIQNEIRENLDHRRFYDRTRIERRNNRESRIKIAHNKRDVEDQREVRHSERLPKEDRDDIRENLVQKLTRERIVIDRRDTRESRNILNTRDVDNRQEIRYNERISQNTRDVSNYNNRLTRGSSQIDRRNIKAMKNLVSENERRVDGNREIRFSRISRETRDENRVIPDHRLSPERIRMERRNIREFRTVKINHSNEKDVDSTRYNEERSIELRQEVRHNPEQRISRERIQMDRRNVREYRQVNNVIIRNERDVESRREIRNNERMSRDTREEMRENLDRRLVGESRLVDRRNVRESRIYRVAAQNERDNAMESRREIRYNERLSKEVRTDQYTRERRVNTRSTDRVIAQEKHNLIMDRRARSADNRNFRDIRDESRLSRSTEAERPSEVRLSRVDQSHNIAHRERESIDARSRNVELSRNRDRISSLMVRKMESEDDFSVASWQYVLYTMQAAYLCALFMQILKPSCTEKSNKMSLRWLPISSHYNPIKVD